MAGIFIQGAWRMTTSKRHEQGLATRRAVLGEAHVARAQAQTSAFDAPFQELITEAAWGHVWSRPAWDHRQRSIVTLALLCAQGHWDEVAMHIRATANTGASRAGYSRADLACGHLCGCSDGQSRD
jgi:4-carboxymuconolactone decarboxylase